MRLYEPPAKEFFRLPNSIFHVPLDATQFKLYAYLVCCSGSKGYCWPTHKKIIQDSGEYINKTKNNKEKHEE